MDKNRVGSEVVEPELREVKNHVEIENPKRLAK